MLYVLVFILVLLMWLVYYQFRLAREALRAREEMIKLKVDLFYRPGAPLRGINQQ